MEDLTNRLPSTRPVAYRNYFFKIAECKHLFMVKWMKIMVALTFVVIICSTILLLSGCQKNTAVTNPSAESKSELRESTKPLQAADLVGYDGTRLRKSVDHIIDAKEKHNRDLEKMAEGGPDQ